MSTKKAKEAKVPTKKGAAKKAATKVSAVIQVVAVNCLEREVALEVVLGCANQEVNLEATLGDFFPSDTRRRGFCGCVRREAKKRGLQEPISIPCTEDDTFRNVVDAISC
jgi:hypothetical protein